MILEQRDCPIKMDLNSDAGWIYVHLYIGKNRLNFDVSCVFSSFNDLIRALYSISRK